MRQYRGTQSQNNKDTGAVAKSNKVSPEGCAIIGCQEETIMELEIENGFFINMCGKHYEIMDLTLQSLREEPEEEKPKDDNYDGFLEPPNWRDN